MFLFKQKVEHVESCLIPDTKILHPLLKDYDDLQKTYNDNVYNDLEILHNKDGNDTKTILAALDKTHTYSGSIKLQNMFMINQDVNMLHQKYKQLLPRLGEINSLLKGSVEAEKSLVIYCDTRDDLNDIITNVIFNIPYINKLNENSTILNIYNNYNIFSPFLNIISPLVMFILTYLFSKFAFFKYLKYMSFSIPTLEPFKEGRYFSGLFTIGMYLFSLYTSTMYSFMNQTLIKRLYEFNSNVKIIQELLIKFETMLPDFFETPINIYKKLNGFYSSSYNIYKNKGKIVKDFIKIRDNTEPIKQMLSNLGLLDAYTNNVNLVVNGPYNYTKILKNKTQPAIVAKEMFMPIIPFEKNTTNSIDLIGKNAIIMGPNAMGKSTLIKSIALNIIMSQSLGIVAAKTFAHTPFYMIDTYINITDKKGEKSLFEMEVERMKDHIQNLSTLQSDIFAFMIIDEMFSGTNPEEGTAASIAVAEQLAEYPNSICIITTHYKDLANIENAGFKKYHLDNYVLKEGVSTKTNALEILKNKNIGNNIVNRAQELKKAHKE
jgi:hypothetical protein